MACDAKSILATAYSNGYAGMSERDLKMATVASACAGGGSGGGLTCGNYAGGQPSFTPSTGCGIGLDTSNGRPWWYYSGSWH